jgi:hypothetical protein
VRILAITENITVDGSIEMLTDWFDPQRQGEADKSDLLEEEQRQGREAEAQTARRTGDRAHREHRAGARDD